MSIKGDVAFALFRPLKLVNKASSDVEKLKERAKKENEKFVFKMPQSEKAEFSLLPGTERECLIIRPKELNDQEKAILYLSGGVTNNWNTMLKMAVQYAIDTGVQTWYPVYPSMSEVSVMDSVSYLIDIYQRMTEISAPEKITIYGVSMGGFCALQILNFINHQRPELPMPGLVIVHSPWGLPDNEEDWELFRRYEKSDPLFIEENLRMLEELIPHTEPIPDWVLHSAQGDFTNAPPTYMYYGEEMLAGNEVLYRRAYERSGSGDKLHTSIEQKMVHGYSSAKTFQESRVKYDETLKLIEEL